MATYRINESELRDLIEESVRRVLNESGIGLIGARNAAMANLKKRIGLGVKRRYRPNGEKEDQQERYDKRESSMREDINRLFKEEFGDKGLILPCSAWYFGNPLYGFHITVKSIEQINAHNFSFNCEMTVDNMDAIPETLAPFVLPKDMSNVILVYTFSKRELRFTRKKVGLTMTPHNDGTTGWSRILKFVGTYNEGYSILAR